MWEVASKICSEARESPESPEGRKVSFPRAAPEPSNLRKEIDDSAPNGPSPKPLLIVNLREVKWKGIRTGSHRFESQLHTHNF